MPTKVLYIAGWGRSGSTLLGNVLGQMDRFFHVGELRHIWDRSLTENRPCGCGLPFRQCESWRRILTSAYGSPDLIDAARMTHARQRVTRTRHLAMLALPGVRRFRDSHLKEFLTKTARLYEAAKHVTDSQVIVDSSKMPTYAKALTMVHGIDLYLVHLIRDPRGTAYSWMRRKYDERIHPDMQAGPLWSSWMWTTWNLATQRLGNEQPKKYLRVRYEDFAERPGATVERILELVAETPSRKPFRTDGRVELDVQHTVAGNPVRFRNGSLSIEADEEWKEKMSWRHRWLVTANTWPMLRKYGYSVWLDSKHRR